MLNNIIHPSWSIIIFCYNEVDELENVYDKVLNFFKTNDILKYEIIIVDDGSIDGSTEKIKAIKFRNEVNTKAIYHNKNKGIGEALISGYLESNFDNVCAVPADGQFDIDELQPFLFQSLERQFISFFRSENLVYTRMRTFFSTMNKFFNSIFLDIKLKDVNWVKVYPGKELRKFKFQVRSSMIQTEICSKLIISDFEPIEVRSKYIPRNSGKSKGNSPKILRQAILDLVFVIFIINKFKFINIKWKSKSKS